MYIRISSLLLSEDIVPQTLLTDSYKTVPSKITSVSHLRLYPGWLSSAIEKLAPALHMRFKLGLPENNGPKLNTDHIKNWKGKKRNKKKKIRVNYGSNGTEG